MLGLMVSKRNCKTKVILFDEQKIRTRIFPQVLITSEPPVQLPISALREEKKTSAEALVFLSDSPESALS